ncbi:MAG: hypothetical protein GWN56_12180 [Nitrosopumilaceae archaeon]|nr:hypothetical protein [Nitrosopumilaceae archaeon]
MKTLNEDSISYNFILYILSVFILIIFTSAEKSLAVCDYTTLSSSTAPRLWTELFDVTTQPITWQGSAIRDYEGASDPSQGATASGAEQIASCCKASGVGANCDILNCNPDLMDPAAAGCGTEPSAYYACDTFNPFDDTDDVHLFGIRVNGSPRDSADQFTQSNWNFLVDLDCNGIGDYSVILNGNTDLVEVYYDPVDNQANPADLINEYCACNAESLTTCTSGSDYSHARSTEIPACPGDGSQNEWIIELQVPVAGFVGGSAPGFTCSDAGLGVCIIKTTSNSLGDEVQKDLLVQCDDQTGVCDVTGIDPTPITLAYFKSEKTYGGVYFKWSTATEAGNAGFNIYTKEKDGMVLLNKNIIPSKSIDSLSPINYSYTYSGEEINIFYISDVDLKGKEKFHGPFDLGQSYGQKEKTERIDWTKINNEVNLKNQIKTENSRLAALSRTQSLKAKNSKLVTTSTSATEMQFPRALVSIGEQGIYRINYEDLLNIGLDLSGVAVSSLALTHKGIPQQVFISSADEVFGAGDYIEFVGDYIKTLYTDSNVYILEVNPENSERVSIDTKPLKQKAIFEQSYTEQLTIGNDNIYTFSSPIKDPWIDSRLFARPTTPVTKIYNFDLGNLASPKGGLLTGALWGITDWPFSPDHHITIKLNGVQIDDKIFDGLKLVELSADLNSLGISLLDRSNKLEILLPGDTQASFDIIDVDSFSLSYERNFIANNGKLVYTDRGDAFEVQNFTSSNIVIYSKNGSSVSKHTNIEVIQNTRTYSVKFTGDKNNDIQYHVFEEGSVLSPELEIAPHTSDLKTGQAQYLIISHPTFLNELNALIAEREKQYSVKLADVEAVYTEFNGGIFDPEAIRSYIDYAFNNLGTIHVLLVGGDSYDYHNYIGNSSLSFIPTFYGKTHNVVNYAPSDALIADLDGDSVQDVSIGRFPVRTSDELSNIIEKTLTYPLVSIQNAVFAADKDDGSISFSDDSDSLIQHLPYGWTVDKAYLEGSTVADAKAILIDSINGGRALTSFFGHSSFGIWTFSGLFNRTDAQNLTNFGLPTVVTQYGCWNSYFVDPSLNTLSHKFLLSGLNGAAAVTGPTSITQASSDRAFGDILMNNLFTGQTIGEAIKNTKKQLSSGFSRTDVIIGWNLLGDPALLITE